MVKLLALDIDGTIIKEDNRISFSVKESIKAVRSMGIRVVLLSGRNYLGMKGYINELELKGVAASANGAEVVNIVDEQILYKELIPFHMASEVIDESLKEGLVPINFSNLRVYTTGFDDLPEAYTRALNQEFNIVKDIKENIFIFPPVKLMLVGREASLARIKKIVEDNFDDVLNADFSLGNLLEVYSKKADKGKALQYIANRMNVNIQDTMCIGDSENDIPMFEAAALSVSMGNAPENVKNRAHFITEHVENDGVAKAIEKFIIKHE
ncbi:MAG: HAD family hydrolase [Eubacteriaceae bacterium]|nr:HAD family hydrolase [Eubacteriaceae bacterium]